MMTSVILAGGENRRFGSPKGLIAREGRSIVEADIEKLARITGKVAISTNEPERYFRLGVPLIGDVVASRGPMSGIFSALYSTGEEEVFVMACDMPFVKDDLISYIINNRGKQATVPVFGGKPEPLLAVYSASLLKTMERLIRAGRTSLSHMIEEAEVKYIAEDVTRRIDPSGESFVNINTPEEYERHFSSSGHGPRQGG